MWKTLTVGRTRDETLAALRALGVTADSVDTSDGFLVTESIDFSLAGFTGTIHLDTLADAVTRITLHRTFATLDEGIVHVRAMLAAYGPPARAQVRCNAARSAEDVVWHWDQPVLQAQLSRTADEPWTLWIFESRSGDTASVATLSTDEVASRVAQMRADVAQLSQPTGARGAAVARWATLVEFQLAAHERFLATLAPAAAAVPVMAFGVENLAMHVRWLVEHGTLFPRADDHCDAVAVVDASTSLAPGIEDGNLGWERDYARLVDAANDAPDDGAGLDVHHVRGPFAAGVLRLQHAHEVHALAEPLDTRAVEVNVTRPAREHMVLPTTVHGRLGDQHVTITAIDEEPLTQLASLLLAARALLR